MSAESDGDEDADCDQRQRCDRFGQQFGRPPVTDERQGEPRVEQLAVRRDEGEEQQPKPNEHEPVRRAYQTPLQHPRVPKGLPGNRTQPPSGGIASVSRSAEPDYPHHRAHRLGGKRYGHQRDGNRDDDRCGLHAAPS